MNEEVDLLDEFNVNPKSEVVDVLSSWLKTIKTDLAIGFSSLFAPLLFSKNQIFIVILTDSIILMKPNKTFVKRMFWKDIKKYDFNIKVKKSLFGKNIKIKFVIEENKYYIPLYSYKNKKSEEDRISEETLSFILEKTQPN
tara:strand:+ start:49 stop:471 length:423 start_codon:yes stop_codon:yes gene_type:complete